MTVKLVSKYGCAPDKLGTLLRSPLDSSDSNTPIPHYKKLFFPLLLKFLLSFKFVFLRIIFTSKIIHKTL